MRKFDITAAKRGEAVCTKGGLEARLYRFDMKNPFPLLGTIKDEKGNEYPHTFTVRGEYYGYGQKDSMDLMMKD